MSRFVFLMLDGVGIGELPDSADYGDAGSDTLGNLSRLVDLHLPHLGRMGLGNIAPLLEVPPAADPLCLPGRLKPLSAGKDTTVGHWEHMGLITSQPFPTYPDGFPEEVLAPFREGIGHDVLGNRPASGTAIIAELGEEHLRTGHPIVYTSADSVFQIAAHTDVVPLQRLYEWCETARAILTGPHAVARVIARPFTGLVGEFTRTKDRRDFSLAPPSPTYLDRLAQAGVPVLALGKISEVFVGRGVTDKIKVGNNEENLALVFDLLRGASDRGRFDTGLLFTNLVDFDMVWGHRNDCDGFARGLEAVDAALPALLRLLGPDDRLIISADHGVDPTTPSTDHSREYVPLLLYPRPPGAPDAVYEGHFSDTGATICAHLLGRPSTTCEDAGPCEGLPGDPIDDLQPSRGWRRYTPVQPSAAYRCGLLPGRVGSAEAAEAAAVLAERWGEPPGWAVVLGSGLARALLEGLASGTQEHGAKAIDAGASERQIIGYEEVPHWRSTSVEGHENRLVLTYAGGGRPLVLLEGRMHAYEGFDLSETQLPVRTLAAWGVEGVILTSAAGAVSPALKVGDVLVANAVLDLQDRPPREAPPLLSALDPRLRRCLHTWAVDKPWFKVGVHATVPGPHYETAADLRLLRHLSADSVSMSLAAELRAAQEEGLYCAAVAVIANAGPPTHDEVLTGAVSAGDRLAQVVDALLACGLR